MSREERIEMLKKELNAVNTYNRPTYCEKCGGVMVFKGVGEYRCEKCGYLDYDDYGKCAITSKSIWGQTLLRRPRLPVCLRRPSGIC